MAMILSLKEKNGGSELRGLYRRLRDPASDRRNGLHGRFAADQGPNGCPNSNMDYNDFTQMNPI